MKNIQTSSMSLTDKIIMNHNTAIGLPGGFSLEIDNLPLGLIIPEASPITKAENGKRSLCKFAKVLSFTDSKLTVLAATNPFEVGDIIMTGQGAKAYAIATITPNSSYSDRVDIVTTTAIENPITEGDGFIYLAEAAVGTGAVRKQKADMVTKFYTKITTKDYILLNQAAYTQVVQLAAGYVAPEFIGDMAQYAIREIQY